MTGKTALIAGASGLVGGHLLHELLASEQYSRIKIIVRKPQLLKHEKLEEVVMNYEELQRYPHLFKVDDVFCCLGTTIKIAGSQEAFKKVDVDYPLMLAKIAKEHGAKRFLVISSLGADAHAKVFYSRMKGVMEEGIKAIGLDQVHIFRPSLLLGNRKETRIGESVAANVAKWLPFVFTGPLKQYKPIEAHKVAQAMFSAAQREQPGIHIHPSREIANMGTEVRQ